VYNLNPFATKYGAITQLQDPRQEIISNLESMMKEAMEALMEIARSPLKNIVFFRDGVSEGEYDAVKDVEVKAINGATCLLPVATLLSDLFSSCHRRFVGHV
jgi:eukaryotic translation initiation factor 2C